MDPTKKNLIVGATLLVAAIGTKEILKYHTIEKNLNIEVVPVPYNVSLDGVEIRLDITVKNPTDYSITIRHPQLKLYYEDQEIITSEILDRVYAIDKQSKIAFAPVVVQLGYFKLLTLFPNLVSALRNHSKVNMTALVSTKFDKFISVNRTVPLYLDLSKLAKK